MFLDADFVISDLLFFPNSIHEQQYIALVEGRFNAGARSVNEEKPDPSQPFPITRFKRYWSEDEIY